MKVSAFPRIEHVPGSHADFDDLVADEEFVAAFLSGRVFVFEKLDGINVSLRRGPHNVIEVGVKPAWKNALKGRMVDCIDVWARLRRRALLEILKPGECLYGEWLHHRVTVAYRDLPAVFSAFALRQSRGRGFLAFEKMQSRCHKADVVTATPLRAGKLSRADIPTLVGRSAYAPRKMEGLILERDVPAEQGRWLKWVDKSYRHPVAGRLSGELNHVADERPVIV